MVDFLRKVEDGWYSLLDRIDPIVPVYRIVDPIDKIVPSLYVIIALVLLIGLWIGMSPSTSTSSTVLTNATLYFVDTHQNPLVGLPVALTIGGKITDYTTNDMGKIILKNVAIGESIHVHAESTQFESLETVFSVKKTNAITAFTLSSKVQPSQPLVFQLVSTGNQLLEGVPVVASVTCPQNPGMPALHYPITDGVFHFDSPAKCDAWYAEFSADGYMTVQNVLLDSDHPIVALSPIAYVTGTINVTVLSAKTHSPLTGILVQRYTQAGVLTESAYSNNQGMVLFTHVEYGSYYLSLSDSHGKFGGSASPVFSIDSLAQQNQTFYLLPAPSGSLSVNVANSNTQNPIENATVKIQRTTDGEILLTAMTNADGTIPAWNAEEKGDVRVIVSAPAYLSENKIVSITDSPLTVSLALHPLTPNNAASIQVHLTDMQNNPITGAQLVLYDTVTQNVVQETNPLVTDASGSATFEGLSPGSYFVSAHVYPYADVQTNPLVISGTGTQQVELKLDTSPATVPDAFITPPDYNPDSGPSFTPCTENCLPSLNVTLSQSSIPAFDPASIIVTVKSNSGKEVSGAFVYLSQLLPSGTKQLYSTKTTNVNGQATVSIPGSNPGASFALVVIHPDFEPSETTLNVLNQAVEMTPSSVNYSIPFGPGILQTQTVSVKNNATGTLHLTDVHLAGDIGEFLDYWKMLGLLQDKKDTFLVNHGETTQLGLDAITLPTVAAILNASEKGSFILTFQSLSTKQKWVQAVPFNATLQSVGSCDADTILVNGLSANNSLEMGAFESVNKKTIQLANGCTVNGQALPLQNLKAKIDWSSVPSGLMQVEIVDPQTKTKTIETLKNGEYVTLEDNFNPSSAGTYDVTLVFVPQTIQPGNAGTFTITFAAESGLGDAKVTLAKPFTLTMTLSDLETCIKIHPEATSGLTMGASADQQSFTIDSSSCFVPVNISFCTEGDNSGCSGGATEGKIKIEPKKLAHLQGKETVKVIRTSETLPGTYDVTVHANTGGADHLLSRIEVNIRPDDSYAFTMEKTAFTVYGKGGKDSTDIINSLLKEQVSVTSGLCEWMEVATNTTGAFWGGFAASSIVSGTLTYVVGLGAVTGQFAVLGLAICPVCSIIGIIVGIIVQMLLTGSENICMVQLTVDTMNDWVINLEGVTKDGDQLLPPDALNVVLTGSASHDFSAKWVLDKSDTIDDGEKGKQVVGVMYTNTSGYANSTPTFAVSILRAKEHIHGDPHHEDAAVTCAKGTFEDGKIGPDSDQGSCDADDVVREEKFHIKLKTAETSNLVPNFKAETFACQTGNLSGQTGPGALPRVAFNWSWNETTGIPLYGCDASNPNGIYCDATQMNIDVMKRVHALEDFLQANNYQFDCPDNPTATPESANAVVATEVPDGEMGITQYGYAFDNPSRLTFTMTVRNNTLQNQKIAFTAKMLTTADFATTAAGMDAPLKCSVDGTLSSQNAFAYSCAIDGVAPIQYGIILQAVDTKTNQVIGTYNFGIDVKKYQKNPSPVCPDQPKTTATIGGEPGINEWTDATDEQFGKFVNDHDVKFTAEVPSIDALNRLLHYEANLIQDGYSTDFEKDFKQYYTQTSFADAPPWFKGSSSFPGYAKFYGESPILTFRNKYFEGTTIPASGKYHVDIDIDISGDDWRFFETDGTPKASVEVNLLHLNDPSPNSPFYRLPFDGQVGLVKDQFDREGYGLNFINQNETIHLNDEPVVTYANTTGNTQSTLTIQHPTDFKTLNTVPETRGQVLYVTTPTGTGSNLLSFSPSLATPVMLRVQHAKGDKPFSAYYELAEGGNALTTGQNLAFWNGSPVCIDYSGLISSQVFSVTPDRAGKLEDKRTDWPLLYALDWSTIAASGNEYLESIFYTPTSGDYALLSASSNVSFLTSNYGSYSSGQILDGTLGLTYNNESTAMDSIQDVFDLVANQSICVQDTGVSARFVWNAPALYAQVGQTSIEKEWDKIESQKLCIQTTN